MVSQMELCEGVVRQGRSEMPTYQNDNMELFYSFGHTEMDTKVY